MPDSPPPYPTVLIVDDDAAIRSITAAMLADLGARAVSAPDGEQALDLLALRGDCIDCVLLDLSMPRGGGARVLKEFRRLRPCLPVVLMTGSSELDAAVAVAPSREPVGFLRKPFTADELSDKLAQVLRPGSRHRS